MKSAKAAKKPEGITVEGLVAQRDKRPYVLIAKDGQAIAQLTMAQARNIAHDLLTMCARTEADAIIHQFFAARQMPEGMAASIMLDFRLFRHELDQEQIETLFLTPSFDPKPQ
jgi:hypothetical protein